jgi:DNA-binding response OmpR family regulator
MPSAKILIVDDDLDLRTGLSIRLKASGYAVNAASDVASAVRLSVEEKPDLIILDLGLPGGSGFTVLQKLDAHPDTARIPVIVLTAMGTAENMNKSFETERVVTFFEKPVDNIELLNAIKLGLAPKDPSRQR